MLDNGKLWVVGAARDSLGEELMNRWEGPVVGTHHDEVDVTKRNQVTKFVSDHGPFSHVAYCAGTESLRWIHEMTETEMQRTLNVNLVGFVTVLQAITVWQESCNVVAVTSDAAKNPMRGSIAYCSSKAGLEMAVRCAARELAPDWRVNGVAPGTIEDTGMTRRNDAVIPALRGWSLEEAVEYETSRIPMARRASRAEIVDGILMVLNGPRYMTGEIVTINGGR